MLLPYFILCVLAFPFLLASEHSTEHVESATRLMQRILTKTATESDTEELKRRFGETSMLEGCKIMNLHSRTCRVSVIQLLCKSGASVTKAEVEAAGTVLRDPLILKIFFAIASDDVVTEGSLSVLKRILTRNIFENTMNHTDLKIAEFCCASLKIRQVKLPAAYLNAAVSRGSIELLKAIIDCGVTHVPQSAVSTAFLDDSTALEMILILIEAGGDPNSFAYSDVPIAFEFVKKCPDFTKEMLLVMIDKGLNLATLDSHAMTILDVAVKYGRFDLAIPLDELGAPTNITHPDETDDEDHKFNWLYFQFNRRHMQVMAATAQDGNIWQLLGTDLVDLISNQLLDVYEDWQN